MKMFVGHNRSRGRILGDKVPGKRLMSSDATHERIIELLGLKGLRYGDATMTECGGCPPAVLKARLAARPERRYGDVVNQRLDALVALADAASDEQAREPGDIVVITWD